MLPTIITVAFGYLRQLVHNCSKIILVYRLEGRQGDCVSSAALFTVFTMSKVLGRTAITRRSLKTVKLSKSLGVCGFSLCAFSLSARNWMWFALASDINPWDLAANHFV